MKNPIISVLVTDGETDESLKFIRCLGFAGGYRIHVQSSWPKARAQYSKYCSRFYSRHLTTVGEWVSFLRTEAAKEKIDLIVPIKEPTIQLFSQNSELLGHEKILALPSFESLYITLNKWRFQRYIEMQGLPHIPSAYIGISGEKLEGNLEEIMHVNYPALLKPTDKGGGTGIHIVNDYGELQRLWFEEGFLQKGIEYLLQNYMEGTDYCLQLYAHDGKILAYTIQKSLQEDVAFYGPQRIMEFVKNDELLEVSKRLIGALAWDGFACVDFRMVDGQPPYRLLEINPRVGQALMGSMLKGVNLADIGCRESLNMELPIFTYHPGLYAHPKAYVNKLLQRIKGQKISKDISWQNSGLKFICIDPKPELTEMLPRIWRRS
jgi:predicted ATP-grasp superfamily ATP-dependent carboligase